MRGSFSKFSPVQFQCFVIFFPVFKLKHSRIKNEFSQKIETTTHLLAAEFPFEVHLLAEVKQIAREREGKKSQNMCKLNITKEKEKKTASLPPYHIQAPTFQLNRNVVLHTNQGTK